MITIIPMIAASNDFLSKQQPENDGDDFQAKDYVLHFLSSFLLIKNSGAKAKSSICLPLEKENSLVSFLIS